MSINAAGRLQDYCPTVEGDDPNPCQSGCGFQAAPGGSYCCGACYFSNGVHGPLCKRIPAPAPWAAIGVGVTTLDAIDAMLDAPTSNGAPAVSDEICPNCGQRTNANLLEDSASTSSSAAANRAAANLAGGHLSVSGEPQLAVINADGSIVAYRSVPTIKSISVAIPAVWRGLYYYPPTAAATKSPPASTCAWLYCIAIMCEGVRFTTLKRYSHFERLHEALPEVLRLPRLPPRRAIRSWLLAQDVPFADRRRLELERYLQTLVQLPQLRACTELHSFLELGPLLRRVA